MKITINSLVMDILKQFKATTKAINIVVNDTKRALKRDFPLVLFELRKLGFKATTQIINGEINLNIQK